MDRTGRSKLFDDSRTGSSTQNCTHTQTHTHTQRTGLDSWMYLEFELEQLESWLPHSQEEESSSSIALQKAEHVGRRLRGGLFLP